MRESVPQMQVVDVQLRVQPAVLRTLADPSSCGHAWEPHLWEHGRAYCPRCGSYARWADDPRLPEDDL